LVQNLLEFFCVYVLPYALPSHTQGLYKNPGQYTKAGIYHGRLKKLTKLPKYCCNNNKYLAFYAYAGYFFLKKYLMKNAENTISEPLDFKIFLGRMPRPPIQTRASRRARLQATPPPV